MRRFDLGNILAGAVIFLGICCLLLAATGFAEASIIPASVRQLLLAWAPLLSLLCIMLLGIALSLTAERMQSDVSKRVMVALGLTAIVVAIGAVVLALTTVSRGDQITQRAGNDVRILEGGGVTVQAVLRPRSGSTLEFDITMDTHSVDLKQLDLGPTSRVVLGSGQSLTGGVWTIKAGGDSHHLGGSLIFQDTAGSARGARTIVLEIEGLPGEAIRRFEWQGAPQ